MSVTALDVAQLLINRLGGRLEAMKLQKLTVYVQWWNLVLKQREAFSNRIEAWADGPVIPDLFQKHKTQYLVSAVPGANLENIALDPDLDDTISRVLKHYGSRTGDELSEMMHSEDPWIDARLRAGVGPGERSNEIIRPQDAAAYYRDLALRFPRAAP